ncbi:alpha-protein kinase 1 [Octopus bimaculoides]|nr:alpha-protein kinase 1 [Octopus bimaculoides]|eukprot:XP_014776572.1 PREDICTED: alpha-protein kinase 1-like [Octopus bimaculoides]
MFVYLQVYHVPPKVQDEPILTFLYNNQDGSILTQLTLDNIGKTDLTYDVHDGDPNFNWSDEQCDNLDKQIINRLQKAVLYHYNPVTSMWYIQDTIVYISKELSVGKKGGFRDVYEMNFLHQDEPLGRYICKRYRKEKDPLDYIDDVKCQMEAGLYVTYFNQALKSYQSDIRIHYLPAAYMHLLDANGDVEFWVNIEPFVKGEFLKLTNNYDYCNPRGCDMSTAFTHFTYFKSAGKLMVVDLQGWLPSGVQNIIYLTDPQFHTVTGDSSTFDFGIDGFKVFFNKVHPKCNHICETLKLERPDF